MVHAELDALVLQQRAPSEPLFLQGLPNGDFNR
jgi:hypothetical protein